MTKRLPYRFLVPGLFLFVLGVGNIVVGVMKTSQYEEVLQELAVLEPSSVVTDDSPLARIHSADHARFSGRRQQAKISLDFYRFVVTGGKFFLLLSTLLIAVAALLKLFLPSEGSGSSVEKAPVSETSKFA